MGSRRGRGSHTVPAILSPSHALLSPGKNILSMPHPKKLPAPGPACERTGSALRVLPPAPTRSSNGYASVHGDEGLYQS